MITDAEWAEAVTLMADGMLQGARFYGINHTEISGDRTIFAERALRALVERFDIRRAGMSNEIESPTLSPSQDWVEQPASGLVEALDALRFTTIPDEDEYDFASYKLGRNTVLDQAIALARQHEQPKPVVADASRAIIAALTPELITKAADAVLLHGADERGIIYEAIASISHELALAALSNEARHEG